MMKVNSEYIQKLCLLLHGCGILQLHLVQESLKISSKYPSFPFIWRVYNWADSSWNAVVSPAQGFVYSLTVTWLWLSREPNTMFFIWKSVNLRTINETVNQKNATPAKAYGVHTNFKGLELKVLDGWQYWNPRDPRVSCTCVLVESVAVALCRIGLFYLTRG